ncbi:MAG: substrate-binding domain-containing protein [Candidatus Hydrogenedentes bacterium]|nr:substrate-binding domain-containing protein [Candidatus Hydrogenedentota bacterium]
MRFIMLFTAFILMVLIAVQFAGDAHPPRPFENSIVHIVCANDSREIIGSAIDEAIRRAEEDLGCAVDVVYTNWESDAELFQLRQLIPLLPGGVIVMGYPANETLRPALEEAVDQEVAVTTFNTPIASLQNQYAPFGLGYAGIDAYAAGRDLAAAAVKKHALGGGARVMLLGDVNHPAREPFVRGVTEVFSGAGLEIEHLVASTHDLQYAPEVTRAELRKRRARGDLPDLICFTEIPIHMASDLLLDSGVRAGEIPLIGLGAEMRLNRRGDQYVSLQIGQDLALQVYLAIIQASLYTTYRYPGLVVYTPYEILGGQVGIDPLFESPGQRFVVLE